MKQIFCAILVLSVLLLVPPCFADSNTQFNVIDFGAVGDGVTNDTAAIMSAVNQAVSLGGSVYFPKGKFLVSNTIEITSSVNLIGIGATSIIKSTLTGENQGVFKFTGAHNVIVENISFCGQAGKTFALSADDSNNITINDCILNNISLLYVDNKSVDCNGIKVIRNRATAGTTTSPFICIKSSKNIFVSSNSITGYESGIQISQCDYITCNNNQFYNLNTGIQLTDAKHITIGNNIIYHNLTGIYADGCSFGTISFNNIYEIVNNGIELDNSYDNILISSNSFSSLASVSFINLDSHGGMCNISGNTFNCTGEKQSGVFGTCQNLNITGNNFTNTVINTIHTTGHIETIMANRMIFDKSLDENTCAVSAGNVSANGTTSVKNNEITLNSQQSVKATGLYIEQSDYYSAALSNICGNSVSGFPVDLEIFANSDNTDVIPVFLIENNYFGSGCFLRNEGNTKNSVVRFSDNAMLDSSPFPSSLPTWGKWDKGQLIYFSNPAEMGYVGAVCVAKGEPGVWKLFGKIK